MAKTKFYSSMEPNALSNIYTLVIASGHSLHPHKHSSKMRSSSSCIMAQIYLVHHLLSSFIITLLSLALPSIVLCVHHGGRQSSENHRTTFHSSLRWQTASSQGDSCIVCTTRTLPVDEQQNSCHPHHINTNSSRLLCTPDTIRLSDSEWYFYCSVLWLVSHAPIVLLCCECVRVCLGTKLRSKRFNECFFQFACIISWVDGCLEMTTIRMGTVRKKCILFLCSIRRWLQGFDLWSRFLYMHMCQCCSSW